MNTGWAVKQWLTEWFFCRDFVAHPVAIVGPGVTVEVDEGLFCRSKLNVGHQVSEQWVFGGVEGGTPDRWSFLVPVARRDAATLLPILQQYILPGSTIVSDCWRAYNTVGLLGYQHLTATMSSASLIRTLAPAPTMLSAIGKNAKMRKKREDGTARTLLDSYLIKYVWRNKFGGPRFKLFCSKCGMPTPLIRRISTVLEGQFTWDNIILMRRRVSVAELFVLMLFTIF